MFPVLPTLQVQRELCSLPRGRERFLEYIQRMTGGTDDLVLPLCAFNPMSKDHVADALDALLEIDAEAIMHDALADATTRLEGEVPDWQATLVVTDDIAGGWTDRELIEANRLRAVPHYNHKRGWLPVLFWVSEPVTETKIREEVQSSLYRELTQFHHGAPTTLTGMMHLEGSSLAFAVAEEPRLETDDLEYSREVIAPYLNADANRDFPTVFTCLYGDVAAQRVGYSPLGLSPRAGCAVALADARASVVE